MEKWGTCFWNMNDIHPDDVGEFEKFGENQSFQEIVRFVEEEETYIKVDNGEHIFRIKSKLFHEITAPKFLVGEEVIVESQGEKKNAIILCDKWHFKQ